MPSAKEEVGQAKVVLGWGKHDAQYTNWRNAVKSWAHTNHMFGKRSAGNDLWGQFVKHMRKMRQVASGKLLLESGTEAIKTTAKTALDKLLQDMLKKARDT